MEDLSDLVGRGFGPLPPHALRQLREDYDLPEEYFHFLATVGVGTVGSVVIWGEPEEGSRVYGGPVQDAVWVVGDLGDGLFLTFVDDGESCAFQTLAYDQYPEDAAPWGETLAGTVREWLSH